jgi:hypothetical protein|tara:strand:- start:247 stop:549 length:303 start_codon:yes stop_codon:yes gene_type:complete
MKMNASKFLLEAVLNEYVGVVNVTVKVNLSRGLRSSSWQVKTMRQTTLDEFGMDIDESMVVKHPKEIIFDIHPSLLKAENIVGTYKELKEEVDKQIYSMR